MRTADRTVALTLAGALAAHLATAAAKIALGRATDLLGIEADGYHSLTDGFGAAAGLLALLLAGRGIERRRQLEALVACGIGASLLALSGRLAADAIGHVRSGTAHEPRQAAAPLVLLAGTLLVNLAVAAVEERRGRRLGSALLLADARHARADAWVTGALAAAVLLARAGFPAADRLAAGVVALLVARSGFDVIRANAAPLFAASRSNPNQEETHGTDQPHLPRP